MISTLAAAENRRKWTALFLALAMAAVVGGALAFEHLGGYIPCKLCLEQRTPYYVGAPLMLLGFVASALHWPAWTTRALLFVGGLLMLYGLGLGVFHSGVEGAWWQGPTDCGSVAGQIDTGGKGILDAIEQFVPPSCDKAALRILGLSLAGWNAIASLVLAVVALREAFARD
jgi:disulfide bond formation protein DsbB